MERDWVSRFWDDDASMWQYADYEDDKQESKNTAKMVYDALLEYGCMELNDHNSIEWTWFPFIDKFFYKSPLNSKESHIVLDVVFEDSFYTSTALFILQ